MPTVDVEEQLDVDGAVEVDREDFGLEHVANADRARPLGRNRDVARMDPEPDLRADGRAGKRHAQPLLAQSERGHAVLRLVDDGLDQRPGVEPTGDRPQVDSLEDLGDRAPPDDRSEEHTSELQSREKLVCRLLLEKKKSYV